MVTMKSVSLKLSKKIRSKTDVYWMSAPFTLQEAAYARKFTRHGSTEIEDLEIDHEDTKIVYLLQHAVKCRTEEQQIVFVVSSSSGDIDIPVILLGIETSDNIDIFILLITDPVEVEKCWT